MFSCQHFSLVAKISSLTGTSAGVSIRDFRVEQLPALMILTKIKAQCEVLSIIHGTGTLSFYCMELVSSVATHACLSCFFPFTLFVEDFIYYLLGLHG